MYPLNAEIIRFYSSFEFIGKHGKSRSSVEDPNMWWVVCHTRESYSPRKESVKNLQVAAAILGARP